MNRTFAATALHVFATADPGSFHTQPVASLTLDLQGIIGDRHYGFTRPAGARERWYRRGTPIRSGRQLSLVAAEELEQVARAMDIPRLDPTWIGANILLAGIPDFSALPWGTRLFFGDGAVGDGAVGDGAVLVNEGDNAPCRFAGAAIAAAYPGRIGLDTLFVEAAKFRRGIVASVERAGTIAPGPVHLRIPAQKPWRGDQLL